MTSTKATLGVMEVIADLRQKIVETTEEVGGLKQALQIVSDQLAKVTEERDQLRADLQRIAKERAESVKRYETVDAGKQIQKMFEAEMERKKRARQPGFDPGFDDLVRAAMRIEMEKKGPHIGLQRYLSGEQKAAIGGKDIPF